MNKLHPLKTLLIAGTLAAALAAGLAQAAEPKDSTHPSGNDGYDSRVAVPNAFVDGTRRDNSDPFADGARIVAGRDLTGVSASPDHGPDLGAEAAPGEQAGPSAESIRTLSGWDRTGPSAPPEHSIETSVA